MYLLHVYEDSMFLLLHSMFRSKNFFSRNQKDVENQWMKLFANKVHIQGMTILLADKVYEEEPQHKCPHFPT